MCADQSSLQEKKKRDEKVDSAEKRVKEVREMLK